MGTYLSTPVTDKSVEEGESLDTQKTNVICRWAVVDQQGWRKSMEDAHVAVANLPVPQSTRSDSDDDRQPVDAKVFGVFDGHGGAEVARFCQLYLVSVLTQQPTWNGMADNHEQTGENKKQLWSLPTSPDDPSIPADSNDLDAAANTSVGIALRSAFHALDRMIDDPARRQEIMQLRNMKPQLGERREATSIPPEVDISGIVPPPFYSIRPNPPNTSSSSPDGQSEGTEDTAADSLSADNSTEKDETSQTTTETTDDGLSKQSKDDTETTEATTNGGSAAEDDQEIDSKKTELQDDSSTPLDDGDSNDDDSDKAVGLEEAAEQDRDMMSDDEEDDKDLAESSGESAPIVIEELDVTKSDTSSTNSTEKVTTMFQKILSLGTSSGQVVVTSDGANDNDGSDESKSEPSTLTPPVANMSEGPDARVPTVTHNGRMICNLPDHPVHAGATAIVAVVTGQVLTVANAGDSRAVLCRAGGVTFPLSFDHKPQQEREMSRIKHAGGFVNHFGRINGNLNLSRSIGDLKYKQVPGIPPADQMITAEPDIKQIGLQTDDEFIILGCDGIWDCLTNEQAVEFVRERIDKMHPTSIGTEMLDQIISEDPRMTQGIGGDNQTVMIIDLQPTSRSYNKSANGEDLTTDDTTADAEATAVAPRL